MIWSLLCRLFATRWFVRHLHQERDWQYRVAFPVVCRAWRRDDDKIGERFFPHFQAREYRIRNGECLMWLPEPDDEIPF